VTFSGLTRSSDIDTTVSERESTDEQLEHSQPQPRVSREHADSFEPSQRFELLQEEGGTEDDATGQKGVLPDSPPPPPATGLKQVVTSTMICTEI
jgi:hypothetical protein